MNAKRVWRVVANPEHCFGSPRLDGTRVTVGVIVGRFAGGDSIRVLAQDYDLPPAAIEAAIRAVCVAASGRHGLQGRVRQRLSERATAAYGS